MFTKTKKLLLSVALTLTCTFTAQASLVTVDLDNMFSFDVLASPFSSGDTVLQLRPPTNSFHDGTGIFSIFDNVGASFSAFGVQPMELVSGESTVIDFVLMSTPSSFGLAPANIIESIRLDFGGYEEIVDGLTFWGTGLFSNSFGDIAIAFKGTSINQDVNFGGINTFASFASFDVGLQQIVDTPDPTDPTAVNAPATLGLMSLAVFGLLRRKNLS